ncbi:MAG: heparinase II/III family protein [Candidatus Babeliales bacterium]
MHYYLHKIRQHGFVGCMRKSVRRVAAQVAYRYNRYQAYARTQEITWQQLQRKYGLPEFTVWWQQQCTRDVALFKKILAQTAPAYPRDEAALLNQCFSVLGSPEICFTQMPWHDDFILLNELQKKALALTQASHEATPGRVIKLSPVRHSLDDGGRVPSAHVPRYIRLRRTLGMSAEKTFFSSEEQSASCSFDPTCYYKDIVIIPHAGPERGRDIKVPWELSRFQHVAQLGMVYEKTKDQRYAQLFKQQITDWLEQNPLHFGVNWVCPMDVAIRAVNWLWGVYYFKHAIDDMQFWQRLTCALHDHMTYLEHNWEIYDGHTSNHYLADLIGYLYLTHFFYNNTGIADTFTSCVQQIKKEFAVQVFDEGTDFEGSTSYHRMVTEFFYHAFVLAESMGQVFDHESHQKLQRMFQFIDACQYNHEAWMQIGDNDSGKLVFGITPHLVHTHALHGVYTYPSFGLSIIKNQSVHIMLRHYAYQTHQPTGHFHQDAAQVTVAVRGVPLIVDPGTYVYTASAYWRNYFRSARTHNGPCIDDEEPAPLTSELFTLPVQVSRALIPSDCGAIVSRDMSARGHSTVVKTMADTSIHRTPYRGESLAKTGQGERTQCIAQENIVRTTHYCYAHKGLAITRTVTWDADAQRITVIDVISAIEQQYTGKQISWYFTLGVDAYVDESAIQLLHENEPVATIQANVPLALVPGYFSAGYGYKKEVPCVQASVSLEINKEYIFEFVLAKDE